MARDVADSVRLRYVGEETEIPVLAEIADRVEALERVRDAARAAYRNCHVGQISVRGEYTLCQCRWHLDLEHALSEAPKREKP